MRSNCFDFFLFSFAIQMEYYVRFADGENAMVTLTFGPMKKLIKAYEKEVPKQNPTDDDEVMAEKKSTVMIFLALVHFDLFKRFSDFFFFSFRLLTAKSG